MNTQSIATREDWLKARLELLRAEKELTRQSDAVAEKRRALPWVKVEKEYVFDTADGRRSLADLFAGRRQLLIQHFMLGPDWQQGCPSCSFMADHTDGMTIHLAHRDVAMVAVSRAPLAQIERFRRRMGWQFPWVSSHGSDFNYDFDVSFTPEQVAGGDVHYNFGRWPYPYEELPGISVFARDGDGAVFHTYSTYGRGEREVEYKMEWVRHHDRYETLATEPLRPDGSVKELQSTLKPHACCE